MTARDLAVEIHNLTELGVDIPKGAFLNIVQELWGIDLDICQSCDRAGGQHAQGCDIAPNCPGCGVWPCACRDDDPNEGIND